MRGETGVLVLAAPLSWWPPANELHCHPLDARRTFFSAATIAGVSVGAADSVVALSRLGKSVMMSGVLTASSVRVYNPFSGKSITLEVCTELSEDALSSGASLRDLAGADRVRIRAAAAAALRPSLRTTDTPGGRHVATAVGYVAEYLQRGRQTGVCSVIFTGEHGAGKTYAMRCVAREVPALINVHGVHCVVERRDVSIARLLQMDEREAVTMIRCVFTVPSVDLSSGTHSVLLLVTLDSVDLLWTASNSLVALVSHQLCAVLDELQEATLSVGCHGVVLATATTTSALPTALLARLSSRRVHVTHPLMKERQNCADGRNFTDSLRMTGSTASKLGAGPVTGLWAADGGTKEDQSQRQDVDGLDAYRGLIGINDVIRDLEEFVVWPLIHLSLLRRGGVSAPKGVVVCGPPGCGKTALLTALAKRLRSGGASGVHVMLVDGLSLIEKEVGRTEKNIAALFATARAMSPTALFLDNIDSLAPPRGQQTSEVSNTADRTLSTLLTEMDGISNSNDDGGIVFVVASAPTVAALDPAVRRPGRLDFHLLLSLPTAEDLRLHIVQRVLTCVAECGDYDDAEITAEMLSVVETYVERWVASKRVSPAEADAFVREVVLNMMERSNANRMDRLREALASAASL